MKSRKGIALASTALASALMFAGVTLATAPDEDSKTHKAMEQVQVKNAFIVKNLKTAAVFKKNQKEIAENAKALSKLGKDVRDETEPAKEAKKDQKDWTKLMDDYVKACDDFAEFVGKSDTTQATAKDKFKPVTATCAACHKDFRKDD